MHVVLLAEDVDRNILDYLKRRNDYVGLLPGEGGRKSVNG